MVHGRIRVVVSATAGRLPAQRRMSGDCQGGHFRVLSVLLLVLIPILIGAIPQNSRVIVGDEAIDFTMQSIDENTFNLRDLRGEQAVILVFFRGAW